MTVRLCGLLAKAVFTAGAVLLISCDGDSNGIGEGGIGEGGIGEGSANLPDVRMHVVAASSGHASAWVYQKESSVIQPPLELEEGKSFWASTAESPGEVAADPVRLTTNLRDQGLEDALFQTVFYQDASPIFAAKLDQAANDRYYIVYDEDGREEGASYATIPQPFQITAPLPNEIVTLANDLVVNWDTPGNVDDVLVHAAVFCDGFSEEWEWYTIASLGNTGTHTIPGSSISNARMTDSCPLTIEVATGRDGTSGMGFNGSEVVGYRISTVTLTATN
jgi:hypothetical protein